MDRVDIIFILGILSMITSSLLPRLMIVTKTTASITLLFLIIGLVLFAYTIIETRREKHALKKEIDDLEKIIKASMRAGLKNE